jgi:hypothetical protein
MSDAGTDTTTETEEQASAEEVMRAAEEELERLIAEASGDGEVDGPTSQTQAQETPEEPLLGDPSTEGSGTPQEGTELADDLQLGGDEAADDPEVLTPEQLGEAGGSEGALDEQLEDVGGGTGGGVPGMGDLGGAQPSSQPSVADGADGNLKVSWTNDDGTKTTMTHYGGQGPDENGVTSTSSVTTNPETGETTTTFTLTNADGSGQGSSVTKNGQGETTSTSMTTTTAEGARRSSRRRREWSPPPPSLLRGVV